MSDMSMLGDGPRLAAVSGLLPIALRHRAAMDRLARLVASVTDAPTATISLLDAHEQYLIGIAGVEEPAAITRRMPAAVGFCQVTVRAGRSVFVSDTARDPRFVEHPMSGHGRTLAYAGVPLRDGDTALIGSVCVSDTRVRRWSDSERHALEGLAELVLVELALYRDIDRRQRLLDGFDHAPVAIMVTYGPRHLVDYTNTAYTAIFGASAIGASVAELAPEELRGFVTLMDSVLTTGQGYSDGDREVTMVWPGERQPRTRCFDVFYSAIHPGLDLRNGDTHSAGGLSLGLLTVVVETTVKVSAQRDLETRARTQALLARASAALNRKLDPMTELRELAEVVVPELADMSTVHLLARPVPPGRMPPLPVITDRVAVKLIPGVAQPPISARLKWNGDGDPITEAILAGSLLRQPIPTPGQPAWSFTTGSADTFRTGLNQVVLAPVIVDGLVIAVASFGLCHDRPTWTTTELDTLEQIAGYAGIALGHGLSYQHARESALILQRSMLTAPPTIRGLPICARYQPAGHDEIGGDWYDAFTRPALMPTTGGAPDSGQPTVVITVGDVVGHDLNSAAAMGQLRASLRSLALDRSRGPGDDLDRLAMINKSLRITPFATLVHAHLTTDGTEWSMRWANAGHPPPLLLGPDGATHLLDRTRGCALLYDTTRPHTEAALTLPPGSTLLLYTDGLIERPGTDLDNNTAALQERIRSRAHLTTDQLCDELLREAPTGDDVAMLAIHIGDPPDDPSHPAMPAPDPDGRTTS